MSLEVESFIVAELEKHGIQYEIHRDFIHVPCPFHEHSGTKKKLGFSRNSGGMHCFVCNKGGHWNEYATRLGFEALNTNDPTLNDFGILEREIERIEKHNNKQIESPAYLTPWERPTWRRLPRDFLRTIPSYEWYDEASKGHRILWPVYSNSVFKGCTSARIEPDASIFPKVRHLGGMDASRLLFPFDHPLIVGSNVLVLVEGQFDALRLLYQDIPAVSVFGTGGWSKYKLSLISARKVKRLILSFDGDLAGERLTDQVLEEASTMFDDVRVMHFPDPDDSERENGIKTIDPGNCKPKYVKLLKRMVRC